MKTILLFIFIPFIGGIAYAQNWNLIDSTKTVFYKHSDSIHITNTIVVDSVEVMGVNTTYYTGYAFKYCDTCAGFSYNEPIIYRYAKEFIGHNVVNDVLNNQFILDGNIIKQHSATNDSWNFNGTLTATTVSKGEQTILGILDSIKTIQLSNSDTIIISKNHGIIRYPDFATPGKYYEMVGYHQGQNSYGEYLPNFWRTYDFNVGDVFFYNVDGVISTPPGFFKSSKIIFKIIDKIILSDSVKYEVEIFGYSSGEYYPFFRIDNTEFLSKKYISLSGESIYGVTNIPSYDVLPGLDVNNNLHSKSFYKYFLHNNLYQEYDSSSSVNSLIQVSKPIYSSEFGLGKQVLYCKVESDSLLKFYNWNLGGGEEHASVNYFNGLGREFQSASAFEIDYQDKLVGAIINNDTLGNIFSIPFDVGINENIKTQLSIYPNPASNQIIIQNEMKSLKLYSNLGELVLEINEPNQIIDISQLSNGLYYIIAQDFENTTFTSKLIIIPK